MVKLLHYSDVEKVYDEPERVGRLLAALDNRRTKETIVVGTGDDVAPNTLGLVRQGDHAVELFESIDPDVETFGNHDFDYGPDATERIVRESPQTWVSSNLFALPRDAEDRAKGRHFAGVPSTTIVSRDETTLGFVGVTESLPSVPPSLGVAEPVEAVSDAVDEVAHTDLTVVLGHLPKQMAERVANVRGVDLVCLGHVHETRQWTVDETPILSLAPNAEAMWEIEVGERLVSSTNAIQVADYPPIEDAVARFERLWDKTGLSKQVARTNEPIPRCREWCLRRRCRIGLFIAAAYRWSGEADIGYLDTRGIRDGPPLSGPITVGELIGLVPFPGDLCVATLSGRDLRRLLAKTRRPLPDDDEAVWWGQVSGASLPNDGDSPTIGGDSISDDATYRVATNDYVVQSGEEFPGIERSDIVERRGPQYEAVIEYATEAGSIPELRHSINPP